MKINNIKELQNIAINLLADIHYKDFMKFTENVEENRILFLTVYTTLPVTDPLRFRKNFFSSYKDDSN